MLSYDQFYRAAACGNGEIAGIKSRIPTFRIPDAKSWMISLQELFFIFVTSALVIHNPHP
jgi:hypothetical protein